MFLPSLTTTRRRLLWYSSDSVTNDWQLCAASFLLPYIMLSFEAVFNSLSVRARKLPITKIMLLVQSASKITKNILLAYPSDQDPNRAPELLTRESKCFLANVCDLEETEVQDCWDSLGEVIWNPDEHLNAMKDDTALQRSFTEAQRPLFREFNF